jgi:hypothetical protein
MEDLNIYLRKYFHKVPDIIFEIYKYLCKVFKNQALQKESMEERKE